jgi:mannose-1-phosphate guanylyltransferase/mannose-6-phosphate isomerase
LKAIILAGGGGTRLWPLSRENFPKQFLNFGSGLSLLQLTVQRLKKAVFIDQIIVATNKLHYSLVQEQLSKIEAESEIIIEPSRRNTAPAIAFVIKYLQEQHQISEEEAVLIVPSDHLIEPEVIFLHIIEQLNKENSLSNKIITFGIRPSKPETGYGYIEIGNKFSSLTFEALRFVEKPDRLTAEKYILNPHFFWNSGMFLFSLRTFWQQLHIHSPHLYSLFEKDLEMIERQFHEMPDLSIDYAIMEKSKDILVCPLAVSWSDVGSWDSVYEILEKDQNKNVKIGRVIAIDTTNSLIIGGKRIVSTIGLDDLIIIETDEAVLISKKGESQRVKALLQELSLRNGS